MEVAKTLKERLINVVKAFKDQKVLVLGDLILDQFIWGSVDRISPEAPVPVVLVKKEEFRLGGAGNVASNIRSLGAHPLMVGVINTDSAGDRIQHELERAGILTAGLLIDLGRPTIVKTRIIAQHQQVCRVDREAQTAMSLELLKKSTTFILAQLPKYDAILVSDYGKGFITQRLLCNVLPQAQRAGKIIAVDPKFNDYCIYRPATILTPNKKETEHASGVQIRDEKSLRLAATAVLKKTKAENLLVTRGEEGMTLFRPTGYSRHIPTFAREVYDVTGAGDTVVATLALALCARANPEEAAIIANSAAGLVVGKLGTASVSPAELIQAIQQL